MAVKRKAAKKVATKKKVAKKIPAKRKAARKYKVAVPAKRAAKKRLRVGRTVSVYSATSIFETLGISEATISAAEQAVD